MSCPYATILGKRGEGVHSSRILGFALNDTIATIIAVIITSYVFEISLVYSLIGWFTAGEVLHILFGVDTAFLELVGLAPSCK